ncbi:MAG TPA: thioredoxin domain-containing protein [Chthoniobacterales bacterium]|nr:thioredoxin domain-containing protein [Chthoniobacterales bacterium]
MPPEPAANRLIHEKSPYLLQHAHNPVDWYPWGQEAFRKAQTEKKPIFLSIGYSTCHWCHVMERESFENQALAEILNRYYVSIKVDREERPDVDRVYMTFVQSTTGSGGWPMSVFLTPELKPFLGGTYYPPDDRYGRPGFGSLLTRIADIWEKSPEKIMDQGAQFTEAIEAHLREAQSLESSPLTLNWLENGYRQLASGFDPEEGGFSSAPKFPRPAVFNFLLRYWRRTKKTNAFDMVEFTLRKMARGGIYDHLGGGFHRYSVDDRWHVPHFEKMLYDQAQLAAAYAEMVQATADPELERTLRETLDYVLRDLTAPEGGFYSAEDADSFPQEGAAEKREGAFYSWTQEEIDRLLTPDESLVFRRMYGVERAGNVVTASDPHGELSGQNVLFLQNDREMVARLTGRSGDEVSQLSSAARQKLKAVRDQRPRPHLDDKIVTAWNGLMISGFAKGFQTLGERRYLTAAQRAGDFLQKKLYQGRLLRSYRGTAGVTNGFAEDYAFLIQGLLDLYEADFDVRWLRWAGELQVQMNALFTDPKGGYFSTEAGASDILFRMKEDHDGAEPSANSVTAMNLARLARIFDRKEFQHAAARVLGAFHVALERMPAALPQMLAALDATVTEPVQIVLAGEKDRPETAELLRVIRKRYLPNKVVLLADGSEGQNWLAQHIEALRLMAPVHGQTAVYVCQNFTCELPVTEAEQLAQVLERL